MSKSRDLDMAPELLPPSVELAKPLAVPSRAYVTFLAGNGDYEKGIVGLMKAMKRVKTAYGLVVAVLPDVPEDHRRSLESQGCRVVEIEPVYPPESHTQFAPAYDAINYSKFAQYSKLIYLDAHTRVFENIDPLFNLPDGHLYAVTDCFCEKIWTHNPEYEIGYCPLSWPAEFGEPPSLCFNTGMFVFEPSLSPHEDLLKTLEVTPPTPFAEQVD